MFLDCLSVRVDNFTNMSTSTRKKSVSSATAQKRAAQKAQEVADVLQSFAATLNSLDALVGGSRIPTSTPRNWWKTQAGRFKDDPSFPEFVAQVQAARKQER